MAAPSQTDPDLMDLEDEELWDMIERHRCKIVQRLSPERLTPYLRQARVIDAMDEEDILHCARFSTRAMRLGHLLDVLHTRGKNGATAFLESLMLVNPRLYTLITGKEANKDPNSFTRLIDSSQLSAFLMNTLSSLQEELMQEKQLKGTLLHHLHKMREKQQQLKEEGECMRGMEHENQRLRREMDAQSQMLSKLKDEQYELSMRYSHALQEKDAVQGRNSDLQEQLYLVKEELHRVKMELQVAQSSTSRVKCEEELEVLQKENRMLKEKLEGQNKLVEMDGSKQSFDETIPDSERLMAQLTTAKKKIAAGEASEKLWKEEKETILQDCRHLQNNYDILKKKTEAFHDQVDELQKERDQAYRARDMVQAESLQFLNEKDSLRKQVMNLTECNSELKQQIRSLEAQLQIWMMRKGYQEDAEPTDVCQQSKHQRLVRMDAICPSDDGDRGSSCSTSESWQDLGCQANSDFAGRNSCSSLDDVCISRLSKSCSNDLPDLLEAERTEADFDYEYKKGLELLSHMDISERSYDLGCLESPVRRRYAQRMSSRLTSIAFQGDDLLKQISIIGGNRTGIFIHQVTPRSAADEMSLLPGYQIMAVHFDVLNPAYKVDLEGMTFEDAHCTLNRVNGFCCLSVRCNMEDYRKLLNTIQNGVLTSGDSFYVRVNLSMPARVEGGLQVKCGDILHITNTMYKNRCQWFAHRVNNYTMKDGESGIIPNYRQAQQQLITSIQRMTWQNGIPRMPKKHVRIISTDRCSSHLLWTSLNCGTCRCEEPTASSSLGRSCLTLMPYTLVTHYKIGVPRPVLLVPSLLGRILSDKLCANKDFMKCDTECLTDAEYATRYQRGDIIGEKEGESIRCCFTRQNVEAVAQQNAHCLLELGLSCLSALIRVGIYPIILHIPLSEKSTKKLRKTRQWWGKCEDLLLECAQREEAELDSLPCLYSTVYPDSWSDTDSLLCTVKDAILDEQKRIIWLENQPCCP